MSGSLGKKFSEKSHYKIFHCSWENKRPPHRWMVSPVVTLNVCAVDGSQKLTLFLKNFRKFPSYRFPTITLLFQNFDGAGGKLL